ncbi:hemagglutinin repeat-containing protein [Enterobacter kobei]|uniref:two-partner secretion domain-containing protein n=1 Tax=Enterobacter kobei TaxID=208224 RepID=UPI001F221694|nr:hemagglutinin repeat-containing protein [Enterobacter kobei]MCF1289506.1 hemagglutinin repeat-containing protein [Enterobacter kobei]
MNKRLYRIVFNKARGMLMVVSELARGCSGGSSSSGIGHALQRLVCRVGALSLALWLASGAVTVQAAGIVADASAPGKQQPTVISTANGTTQVNIQTPSAGGVSRNTYSQFDVGRDGAILNNAHKNTSTELGGMVTANPWLAKGEAKVILNEVNARNPSQLNGYIEVAGQKADVIIASPSGITCDGCGFINAGRATLTTGTAQMQDGRITGYQVERGEIIVNGNGLDASGQAHTDIIARAVQVNAAIHAQDLRVTTGRNTVDAAHEKVTALADNGAAKPVMALDVSQVGGMYAGKIRLIGTEKGVGVRNAGNIGAEAGTVTLSADGRIENSGTVWSSADVALSGTDAIQNSGSLAAQRNVSLTGKTIASTGTLAAGVQPDGTTGRDGDLTLNASGKLEMHGLNVAGGNIRSTGQGLDASGSVTQANAITLNAGQGDLSTAGAEVIANDALSVTATGTLDNSSGLLAADQLTLTAKRLQNHKGQISQSGTRGLTLNHQDGIDNREGVIAANATVNVNAASLDNRKGQIVAADTDSALTIKTAGLTDNREGELAAAGSISMSADTLNNSSGFISAEHGRVALTSRNALANVGGTIAAHDTLTLDSAGLNNDEGLIQSGADMIVDTHGNRLSNNTTLTNGGIVSFGTLNVNAGSISNQHGMLASAKETVVTAADVDNRNGTLSATGSLNLHVGSLENTQGTLVSGGDARIDASRIDNQKGMIVAQGDLAVTAQRLDNDSCGLVQSGGDLTLAVDGISNRNSGDTGGIVSQGNLSITTTDLQNDAGVLLAEKRATLDAARFSNIAGTLYALDTLTLATRSDTDNRQGVIQGSGLVLDTHGWQLDNREGTIYSLAEMQLATAALNNQNGTLGAKGEFTLRATSLDNRSGGRLVGEQEMTLNLERLDNQDGQIQSLGELAVNAVSGAIDNTLGLIRSGATVTLNAASLINRNTQAEDKGIEGLDVKINSQQFDNALGTTRAGNTLSIANAVTLDNTQGELSAEGALSLSGAALRLLNADGVVIGGENVTLEADALTGDGQLLSLGDMTIHTQQSFNNAGDVIANGSMTFTTPGGVTNSGNLLAGAKLDLSAASLFNAASGEIAAGATWLTLSSSLSNYGLIDGSQTWLRAETLTNAGTGRIYGDHLSIQATTLNNLAQDGTAATLAGRQRVDIGAQTINNRDHALIYSDGAMAIGGRVDDNGFAIGQAQTLNNHSATIESAGDMALSIGQLNNINDHFSTEVVLISTEQIHEYQQKGSPTRWDADADGVFVDHNSADHLLNLNTPDDTGANNDNFYEYTYTRTIEEEVIAESDPGKILAGGNMLITANQVLNDKSQIVAGGTLGIFADSVDNVMPEGSRWITDAGSVTHYSRKSRKGGDSQGKSTSDYAPPVVIQSITLSPGKMEGNSQADGSGMTLSPASAHKTDATLSGTGSLAVGVDITSPGSPALPSGNAPGKWIETPASDAQGVVVRAAGPDIRLPDSSLTAGNNLTVVATDGDLLVHGSQLDAQNDLWLQASRDVNLISALNTSTLDGQNESHGGSAGVGIGYGSGGAGISVSASVNGGKGTERGNGTTRTETTVNSGDTLTIVSGRDTNLTGAQVSGESVLADIGRNLTITSEQDTDRYDSKQQNASAGGSFTFGTMSGSASVNYSRDSMNSDYVSVKEQSGIFAGSGGFDINVGGHTQLDGAVIASTATADNNRLDTGTLGWRDIHNTAEYDVEHQSAGISTGGSTGGSIAGQFAGNMASNLLVGADSSGSAEGTTRAAIGEGTVTVRDGANQTQDVATLSRDTANANGSIDAIFDKEKEQRRMEEAQLIGEIGSQVADIARTQGEINALEEARKVHPEMTTDQLKDTQAYRDAQAEYGTGSDMQRAIQAATSAAQGLAGGDMTAALAGAAAPYVAEVIGHRSGLNDGMEKAAAHAVANAVLAAMQGKDALAGAAGAAAGELAGGIALEMYGKDVAALSESEKQTISALATLAAGIAGGVAGDGTASAIAGAQSGKTVVENNALSLPKGMTETGQAATSWVKYAQENNLSPEQVQAGLKDIVRGDLPESADIIKAILSNNPGSDTVMALLTAEEAKDYALALLTSIPAEKALSLAGKAAKVIDNKILISAAEKISTAKPGKQFTAPRDLNEQTFWKQIESNPSQGGKLPDMNNDPRFPASAGFQKMEATHYLPDGSPISVHYQYNVNTGKAYDMKIVTPQRNPLQPGPTITDGVKK